MRKYSSRLAIAALGGLLGLGLAACEKKGPMERAGEQADEAVDSVRRGAESTAEKVDDAADNLRN